MSDPAIELAFALAFVSGGVFMALVGLMLLHAF